MTGPGFTSPWFLVSSDPRRMRTIRRVFTGVKLTAVLVWGLYWVIVASTMGSSYFAQWTLDMLQIIGKGVFIALLMYAFNCTRYRFPAGRELDYHMMQSFAQELATQFKIPLPIQYKTRNKIDCYGGLDGIIFLNQRSKLWRTEIFIQLLRLKYNPHLGLLLYQIITISLYLYFIPQVLPMLFSVIFLGQVQTYESLIVALPFSYLAFTVRAFAYIGGSGFIFASIIPIMLTEFVSPAILSEGTLQNVTRKRILAILLSMSAIIWLFGWSNGVLSILSVVLISMGGLIGGMGVWVVFSIALNKKIFRDYYHVFDSTLPSSPEN